MEKKIKWNKLAGIILLSGLFGYVITRAFIDSFGVGVSITGFALLSILFGRELSKLKDNK